MFVICGVNIHVRAIRVREHFARGRNWIDADSDAKTPRLLLIEIIFDFLSHKKIPMDLHSSNLGKSAYTLMKASSATRYSESMVAFLSCLVQFYHYKILVIAAGVLQYLS